MAKLRVLFATSEIHPLIKTGGLADVSYGLPNALRQLDVDIRLLLPGYPAVMEQLTLIEVQENIHLFQGLDPVRLLVGMLPDHITPIYVIDCPRLYAREGNPYQDNTGKDWQDNALRFGALSKVASLFGNHNLLFKPDIVHCNDWQTGLAMAYMAYNRGRRARSVMSVHNLAYQGLFPPDTVKALGLPPDSFNPNGLEFYNKLSFLKSGLFYTDWITTVSPSYAQEIQAVELGCGLEGLLTSRRHQLTGILNGIDTQTWNPETDQYVATHYNHDSLVKKAENTRALRARLGLVQAKQTPLLGMITRLTQQKGFDLLMPIIPDIIRKGAQIALLGSGDKVLETRLQQIANILPGQISVTLGTNEELAHQIIAGADVFLMPSRFEPCGLTQMYSMHYGTVPVVRHTGGLADTVVDMTPESLVQQTATGFVFEKEDPRQLLQCIQQAITTFRDKVTWQMLQKNGMKQDFSWLNSAQQYIALYSKLLN